MRIISDVIVTALGGYSSEANEELIDQTQGECYLESMVKNKEALDEILQQATLVRSVRT